MKYILTALITFVAISVQAQDKTITISYKDQSINVIVGEEENEAKFFTLSNEDISGKGFLKISIDDVNGDKDWKRNFSVYDSSGNSIKDFKVMKKGNYCIKLNELKSLLQPQTEYFIYTTAIPVDPQKAMLVKMGRQIICGLKIL